MYEYVVFYCLRCILTSFAHESRVIAQNEMVLKRSHRFTGVAAIDCWVDDNHLARFQGDGYGDSVVCLI